MNATERMLAAYHAQIDRFLDAGCPHGCSEVTPAGVACPWHQRLKEYGLHVGREPRVRPEPPSLLDRLLEANLVTRAGDDILCLKCASGNLGGDNLEIGHHHDCVVPFIVRMTRL